MKSEVCSVAHGLSLFDPPVVGYGAMKRCGRDWRLYGA
jgi:hypothetical protein